MSESVFFEVETAWKIVETAQCDYECAKATAGHVSSVHTLAQTIHGNTTDGVEPRASYGRESAPSRYLCYGAVQRGNMWPVSWNL